MLCCVFHFMTITFRARIVLPISSPPIEDGMVRVQDGHIAFLGPWDGSAAKDLGDVVLMPGLINAHCHLDYTMMRGAIPSGLSFSEWIRRIIELKNTFETEDYLQAISSGLKELRHHGTTSVLNIESFPNLMQQIPPPPLRTWWFYEMLDVKSICHPEDIVLETLDFLERHFDWQGGFGLSPHSPYTASLKLYGKSRICCEKYGLPFTTHLAESDEELSMFRDATGPLYSLLQDLGRDMGDTSGDTPISHLLREDALPDGAILVHMNCLEEGDWQALRGRRFSIVHCPCSHDYFERRPFPLTRFLEEGFNLCLGTDSLASNHSLNMFSEMQSVRRHHPAIDENLLLDLVTRNAAYALGLAGKLGELSPGAKADMITIPYSGALKNVVEAVVWHHGPVPWTMVAGSPIFP